MRNLASDFRLHTLEDQTFGETVYIPFRGCGVGGDQTDARMKDGGHACAFARGATADVRRFAPPTRARFELALGNAIDEEIEHRFRSALDLAFRHAPARKMSVDVHAGKTVDQRAAGDLHLLQVRAAEL